MSTNDIPNLDAFLRKVRALRDLAARSTSLAEAETAAAQADAILQRYRLAEADVEAAGEQPSEAIGESEEPLWTGGARTDTVSMRLSAVLAKHYGCVAYRQRIMLGGRAASVTLRIVGRPSDVAIVRYMFAWLCTEIGRLGAAERRSSRSSFGHGAVTGIDAALARSTRATVAAAASSGNAAMVLASRADEAQRWLATATPDLKEGRAVRGSLDDGAFRRGVEAGGEMHFGAALPAGRGRLLGDGS